MANGFCAALLTRVGGDAQVFDELCDIFLDDAPKRLALIRAAVDAGDAPALRAQAHALKGAAGVFEASDVVAAARQLEQIAETGDLLAAGSVCRELETLSAALLHDICETRRDASRHAGQDVPCRS